MKKALFRLFFAASAALGVVSSASGEDGWIACNGTSFINTGHFIGPNTRVELDFAMDESAIVTNNLQERLVGMSGAANDVNDPVRPRFELYIGRSSSGVRLFSYNLSTSTGSRQANNCYRIDAERHTIIIDHPNKSWKVMTDGVAVNTDTFKQVSSYTSQYPLGLFAKNTTTNCIGSTYSSGTKMKCYGLKIYESGTLVKNFVPCLKGGKPGMKEMISGRFHTGERLSSFTAGGDIMTEMDDPYIWTPRNVLKGIGAETNTFIDTGYYVKPQTRIALDFAMLTPEWTGKTKLPWPEGYNPYVFATYGNINGGTGANQNFTLWACASNGSSYAGCYYFNIGSGDNKLDLCPIDAMYNIRRTFVLDSNSVRVITAGYTNCVKYSSSPLTGTIDAKSLKLMSQGTGTSRYSNWKIYGMKIWEDDVLVKDYVPYVTNGVPGLLNTLDDEDFLTSRTRLRFESYSDGLRTNVVFDVGGSLTNNPAEMEAYLEFDGLHQINTGYSLISNSCIEADFALWNTRYEKDNGYKMHDIYSQGAAGSTGYYGIWLRFSAYCDGSDQTNLRFQCWDKKNSADVSGVSSQFTVPIDNSRMSAKTDCLASRITIKKSGVTVYDNALAKVCQSTSATNNAGVRRVMIGASYAGGTRCALMRLYSCKIHEDGVLQRCFVPYKKGSEAGLYDLVNGKAYALLGGKVYGMGFRGTEDYPSEFQIAPEPTKLTRKSGGSTLTCLAAGAQSYEWYEDGVKIEGETGDSLALTWTNRRPHVRTYSVVPVYNVFNETVKGDPASAVVEYTPVGIVIKVL